MRKPIFFSILIAFSLLVFTSEAWAKSAGIVVKPSAYTVSQTIDRLEAVFKAKGIKVFARVSHTAAAESLGRELVPAEVLLFGTPKIAVPLLESNIVSGIDLPLKAMAYQDDEGKVFLVYNHPGYLARRHAIKGRNKLIGAISRILTNLTDQAVKDK